MTSCQFMKLMDQSFSQILTFPVNLMMDFKKLAEVITLKGPSGSCWLVRLSMVGGHVYLKEGWKEFVEANHVEVGDCLVFEYCSSSCFSVLIFDRSGCEREASYLVRIMNPILTKEYQAGGQHERLPDFLKFSSPRLTSDDNSPLQVVSDEGKSSSFKKKIVRRRFGIKSSAHNDKSTIEHAIQSKKVEKHSAKHGSVNMQEGQTTTIKLTAKVKYLRRTKAIRAETPYFTKTLSNSHLNGTNVFLTFPYNFAVEHFHLMPQKIFLRYQGNLWSVRYEFNVASYRDSVTGLSGKRWLRFVQENGLCKGDGCIFVLSETEREKILDVHIVRFDD